MTETVFDVQIDFKYPGQIARSKTEPDTLLVRLTEKGNKLFTDSEDFTQLDVENFNLETQIDR